MVHVLELHNMSPWSSWRSAKKRGGILGAGDQVDHSTTRNEVVPVATMVLDSPRGVVSRVVGVW